MRMSIQTKCPRCGYISIHDAEMKAMALIDKSEPSTIMEINEQIAFLESLRSTMLQAAIRIPSRFLKRKFKLYLYKRYHGYVEIIGVTKALGNDNYEGVIINDARQGWKVRALTVSDGYKLYRISYDLKSTLADLGSTDGFIPITSNPYYSIEL